MSLPSTLREAADQNQALLVELAATDYAPSALGQNTSYIEDLKTQIASTDKELVRLRGITEDERKDHLKYRDSNVKRWAYKLQGSKGKDKFISKQEKEEKEFLEAWQKECTAKEGREELARALSQAEQDRTRLETDSKRQQDAQQQLDQLYSSLFSGPTPEVPGEDDLEQSVEQAKAQLDQTQGQLKNDQVALENLTKAYSNITLAASEIEDALHYSRADMMGGGMFADMMERDSLAKGQSRLSSTIYYLNNARKSQPAIRKLPEVFIDEGHVFSDVLFDNIFSDMAQHDRIKSSAQQIAEAKPHLKAQLDEQNERVKKGEGATKQAGQALEDRRKELQRVRSEAFERLANGAADDAPPPAYQS